MTDHDLAALVMSAERRWMDSWVAGAAITEKLALVRSGNPVEDEIRV